MKSSKPSSRSHEGNKNGKLDPPNAAASSSPSTPIAAEGSQPAPNSRDGVWYPVAVEGVTAPVGRSEPSAASTLTVGGCSRAVERGCTEILASSRKRGRSRLWRATAVALSSKSGYEACDDAEVDERDGEYCTSAELGASC